MDKSRLDMDVPFGIGEASISWIVDIAHRIGAERVLEFGSGRSTVRLALELPHAQITSLEHHPRYADETQRMLLEFGVTERVTLIRSKLGWWSYANRTFYTYIAPVPIAPYDLVLIDGPPGYMQTGRQGTLYKVFEMLPIGAHVILDDFSEHREQRTSRRWARDYPDSFTSQIIEAGNTLLLLVKKKEYPIRAADFTIRATNIFDNGRAVLRMAAHQGAQLFR